MKKKEINSRWRQFKNSSPGTRFQKFHDEYRKTKWGRAWWTRALIITVCLILFVVGVFFMFVPGPAVVFYAIAGALGATQSRWMARNLDWLEVKLRPYAKRLAQRWKKLPDGLRAGLKWGGACFSMATLVGGFWLTRQ